MSPHQRTTLRITKRNSLRTARRFTGFPIKRPSFKTGITLSLFVKGHQPRTDKSFDSSQHNASITAREGSNSCLRRLDQRGDSRTRLVEGTSLGLSCWEG